MSDSKKAVRQHQQQFKNLLTTHPIRQLLTIKNIKLSNEIYRTLETKFSSYREFPIITNDFFRVFYIEMFRYLINKHPNFENLKEVLDNVVCIEQMAECQVSCKTVHSISDLKAIYAKILKIIFNGKDTCDPETGFQNLLTAITLDTEIDKFGILLIRGNLYKWSLAVTQPEDEYASWLIANRRLFEKTIKNLQEECDEELLFQSIAIQVFEIRLHIYHSDKKIKLPLENMPQASKKVKIKLLELPGLFVVLEKKKDNPSSAKKDQPGLPRSQDEIPQNQNHLPGYQQPRSLNELPQKSQASHNNPKNDEYILSKPLLVDNQGNIVGRKKPIEDLLEENKYGLDSGLALDDPSTPGNAINTIASLKKAADGVHGCRHCGSSDVIVLKKVCPSCYNLCDICLSDSTELIRYTCAHSFCFICISNIVTTLNDYKPITCPTCCGLG